MKQSEIDRALVLIYRSNNAHDEVNFARPAGAMDYLPMSGLEEYAAMLEHLRNDVEAEITLRKRKGQLRYSPNWYRQVAAAH